jgi:hypothetical protein
MPNITWKWWSKLARFRHIALNLLKKNKDSVNLAQMKSLMNDEYREKLIFG